ncbi:putative F-box protein [Cardamine amara subsp. amara]|uniref:F-box protein n=1 Tax=Cardamine amara subsp. amara TaxID=228776 RepID=A0ABD0YZZ5_CARAN
MWELHDDLVEEILCRVPATSLKRLRYTCKLWNRLFNDRKFTRKHFDKSPKESLILMFKKLGVCSMSINLHRSPTAKITDELNLIFPDSSLDQFKISPHCHSSDGLLLCSCVNYKKEDSRLVVLNPCTGQTKWIKPTHSCTVGYFYAFGSYQDNKSGNNSYKILSHTFNRGQYINFEIYDMNSNLWRTLDVTMDCNLKCFESVSLKGKTYWIVSDEKEKELGIFLISFDYTTEKFERLCLPYHEYPRYQKMSLSVVREEKLSVLLQPGITSNTEIWVTNKIGDETKVVSWIKVLALDLKPRHNFDVDFFVDEEKKVLVCTEDKAYNGQNKVYIVGEDSELREVNYDVELRPYLFNYVPSLTQIIKQGND